jgi:hypothetical protein
MYSALQRTLDVDDALMKRVLRRRGWYLVPDASYPSLQAYIDATHAALVADVRKYQAEVRSPPPRPPTASAAARSSRPSAPPPRPPRPSACSRRARPSARAPARDTLMMCVFD